MEDFSKYLGEFIGAFMLVYLGDTVLANALLKRTSGYNGGAAFINFTWGLVIFIAVTSTRWMSGGFLNPSFSLGFAITGVLPWHLVPGYLVAEFLGGVLGSTLTYITYKPQFDECDNPHLALGIFCSTPYIKRYGLNFFIDFMTTFMLIFVSMCIGSPKNNISPSASPVYIAFISMGIGSCLSGPTNFSVNPSRDLSSRLVYMLLPIKNKNPQWDYAWIPVFAPLCGCIVAGLLYNVLSPLYPGLK